MTGAEPERSVHSPEEHFNRRGDCMCINACCCGGPEGEICVCPECPCHD